MAEKITLCSYIYFSDSENENFLMSSDNLLSSEVMMSNLDFSSEKDYHNIDPLKSVFKIMPFSSIENLQNISALKAELLLKEKAKDDYELSLSIKRNNFRTDGPEETEGRVGV